MSFMPPIAKRSISRPSRRSRGSGPTHSSSAPMPFSTSRRVQLAILAARYTIPATFAVRDYVEAGGLMSYGTNINDAYRARLAFMRDAFSGVGGLPSCPSSSPLHSSLSSTSRPPRPLGLTVPPTLLARADEVIE